MRGARRLVDALRFKQPAKKALGQHFLVHDDVLEHTVEWAEVDVEDHVLEVGPGPGVLTEVLLEKGCKVTAVELDAGACEHLRSVFASELDEGRLVLIEGDALTVRWPNDISRLVANIPYQISSPLIDAITRHHRNPTTDPLRDVVVLVQEEFAERVVMEYESDVGSLGMVVALDFDVDLGRRIPPHAFSPMPKVHSRLLRMTPHDEEWPCGPTAAGADDPHGVRTATKETEKDASETATSSRTGARLARNTLEASVPFHGARPEASTPTGNART